MQHLKYMSDVLVFYRWVGPLRNTNINLKFSTILSMS